MDLTSLLTIVLQLTIVIGATAWVVIESITNLLSY